MGHHGKVHLRGNGGFFSTKNLWYVKDIHSNKLHRAPYMKSERYCNSSVHEVMNIRTKKLLDFNYWKARN